MDPTAVTPESFNFFVLFMKADWVVKAVMLGLGGASLWSWTVILDKAFRFSILNREAEAFEDSVASGKSLEEVAAAAGERPRHVLPRMLQGALKEWREARAKGLTTDTQAAFLIERIDRVLDAAIARETARIEEGLGSLAIVATASPFIGLFGTVWGIMNAFQSIAIPAYIAFNAFSTAAGKFSGRLEGFADDLSTAIQRRLAEKV
jgi:biopolymer transport protein TolQ